MEYPSTPSMFISPEPLEQSGKSMANVNMKSVPSPLQQRPRDHVAILWDIENCPVPSDVRPEDVAGNIRMALRVHPVIKGAVTMFSAYGDFNAFPRRLREGCQRTGVKLIDVPNGRKDAADKAILVDMFLFALDNPPPSSIMLISGDVDFAPALHILGQRGYTVILVIPANVGVSSALSNAGSFVWDWPSVARGEGFLPPAKAYYPSRANPKNLAAVFRECHINDTVNGQNEEEAIVYRGISQNVCDTRDFSMVSQSFSEYNSASVPIPNYHMSSRSNSLPCIMNEVLGAPCNQNDLSWVQPGDLNGLKAQLVKMLQLSGGSLPLTRVPAEYQKMYGRPFYISEYGAPKLVNLLKKMADALSIEGRGQKRFVYLRNTRTGQSSPSFVLLRRENKGKVTQEDNIEVMAGTGSSEECSDEERVGIELKDKAGENYPSETAALSQIVDLNIAKFKFELQEIMVSYSCRVFLGSFEAIYEQRYKGRLDYQNFGVNVLEELLEKVDDVVVLQEEPVSKRKFMVAAGG